MSRIQLKFWRAPLAVLSAQAPVGLAEGEVAIVAETNMLVKRPDGDPAGMLLPVGGGSTSVRAKVATVENLSLLGLPSVDGVALVDGDRVLVRSQVNSAENGLYVVREASPWVRAPEMATWESMISAMVVVELGGINGDTVWLCTSDSGGALDVTASNWQAMSNRSVAVLGSVQPGTDLVPYFTSNTGASTFRASEFGRTFAGSEDAIAARTLLVISAENTPLDTVEGMAAVSVQEGFEELQVLKADLESPILTGTPTAPTAPTVNSSEQIANTAHVKAAIADGTAAAALKLNVARTISATGEATGEVEFDGTTNVAIELTLSDTGVEPGTYSQLTVDSKGRVTTASNTGGVIDGAAIGNSTIENTPIGQVTPAVGGFTSLDAALDLTVLGAADIGGNVTAGGDLVVNGNLTVNGATTTVSTEQLVVQDPLITLGGEVALQADDNLDRGIQFRWHDGTSAMLGFFGFDESTGKFAYVPNATNVGEVISGEIGVMDAKVEFANVIARPTTVAGYGITNAITTDDVTNAATANKLLRLNSSSKLPASITGNADGNAATATKLQTARTITLVGAADGTVTFDGTANVSMSVALRDTGVTAGTYTKVTVGLDGRVIAASNPTTLGGYGITDAAPKASPAFTGIPTAPTAIWGTATTQLATTAFVQNALNNFNSGNVETANRLKDPRNISLGGDGTGVVSFDGSQDVVLNLALTSTGVTAGTYMKVTVDSKGRVSGGTNTLSVNDIPNLSWTKITSGKPTTLSGYGITDGLAVGDYGLGGQAPTTSSAGISSDFDMMVGPTGTYTLTGDYSNGPLGSALTSYSGLIRISERAFGSGTAAVQEVFVNKKTYRREADLSSGSPVWSEWEVYLTNTSHNHRTDADNDLRYQAINSNLKALADNASNGILVRTNLGAVAARAIATASTGRIVVTNGNGVSGNPTIDLAATSVAPGTYTKLTVDTYGRVISAENPATLAGMGITDAAPLESPSLTGTPSAPTAAAGVATTQIANTAFVRNARVGSADKLAIARTITLAGAVTGSVGFDGSANATINCTMGTTGNFNINTGSPTLGFQDTDNLPAYIHVNGSRFYVLRGAGINSTTWAQYNGQWPMYLNLDNNDAVFGGNVTAAGDIIAFSDARRKVEVRTIEGAVAKVEALRGVTYVRSDFEDKSRRLGLIAQEVREVLPEVVVEDDEGMLSVAYGNIVGVLVEAVKEQQDTIRSQQAQIDELRSMVERLLASK